MSLILDGTAGVTFPSGSGTQAAQSKVLQVVQITNNTQYSTTSTSFVSTALAASITPLFSTSKILVIVNLACLYNPTSNAGSGVALYKSGSQIFSPSGITGTGNYAIYGSASGVLSPISFAYLDSPATTSSTTYTIYQSVYTSGTSYINYTVTTAPTSTITLMEIAA